MMPLDNVAPILCHDAAASRLLTAGPRLRLLGRHHGAVVLSGQLPAPEVLRTAGLGFMRLLDRHYLLFEVANREGQAVVEQALFDLLSATYEREIDVRNNLDNLRTLVELVLQDGPHPRPHGPLLLDYGCGTGLSALLRAEMGVNLIGCDSSKGMRDAAARRDLTAFAPEELSSVPDAHFHGAIAGYVFHLAVPTVHLVQVARTMKQDARLAANFHKGIGRAETEALLDRLDAFVPLRIEDDLPAGHGEYRLWRRT